MFVSQVSADRMNEIYDTPTAEGAEKFEPKGHDIVFEHVGFSYDEKEVLHDEMCIRDRYQCVQSGWVGFS